MTASKSRKPGPLAQNFDFRSTSGHLIRMVRERSVAAFVAVSGSDEVSVQQLRVLVALYQKGRPVFQTELGEASGIDRSTIGEMIHRMVRRGLVRRRIPNDNRRARELTITPAGEKIMHQLLPKLVEANELVLAPLTDAERDTFVGLMRKLCQAPPVAKLAPRQTPRGSRGNEDRTML
ncbi:MAG: MarR family transcriptional regulator [Xanthobacteraceae bacterium]|nr:MarR family transcriptional regulator [Xanthobacteraceae bacterium]